MAAELGVVGRHAMLFDDDATLEFVNSKEALIEWNSLFIDRFDVRNLITAPPSSFRNLPTSYYRVGSSDLIPDDDSHLHPDLDFERFADLSSDVVHDDDDHVPEVELTNSGGYNCVPFSYGNSSDATDQKDSDTGLNASSFLPPFPVPENLLQNLPSTEKVHQIIARTAMFVGEHGGQSEIVLRVKQGDNPTFGFLMPHHHLHPYFRYLVDHQELLKTENNIKSQEEKTNGIQASGALSLLGSVYGSGEDEDGAADIDGESKQIVSGGTSSAADLPKSDHQSEQTSSAGDGAHKDETVSVHTQPSKVKASINSKHGRVGSMKFDGNVSSLTSSSTKKTNTTSLFPISHAETSLVDPPSEMKRLVDRIVEIILKNGKDFETVLIEQDKKCGKFPFLLPSNQYNSYYLRVLKKAQESRISSKTFPGKDGLSWQEMDKNATHKMKDNEITSLDESDDLDLDYGKKEKFKMVIPKSKKDSQDQPSKESQQQCGVTVDATAAAAILQAATRGIRNPNLNIFSKMSHGSTAEGELPFGCALKENREHCHGVRSDIDIGKIAVEALGGEPNSPDEQLLKQQKLKAERLRRAKMFAAMIKSGVAPGTEPPRSSSAEPVVSGNSGLATENTVEVKAREDSNPPVERGVSNEVKSVQNLSNDENDQKPSKRRHYRSRVHDDGEDEGSEENGEDGAEVEDKRSRKRHKSRHSSRHHRDRSKDRHKHRRRHSSKSKESRHRQKSDCSSDEDHKHRQRRHRYDESSEEEKEKHKRRHGRESSVKEEKEHRKRRRRVDDSSDEESKHHRYDESSEEEKLKHKRRHGRESSVKEEKGHRKRRRRLDDSSDEESKHHRRHEQDDSSFKEHHKRRGSLYGSTEESKHHKRKHMLDVSSKEESKYHKRRYHESRRKDKHREKSRKSEGLQREEVESEEGEIKTRSSNQSLSAIGDDRSREASIDPSRSPHREKRTSLPPSETTEVPDDLRAKIRAMLLATM